MTSLLALLLAAVPVRVSSGLEPADDVRDVATVQWNQLERWFQQATGRAATPPRASLTIERSKLAPGKAGVSEAGRIELRQTTVGVLSQEERVALRHEVAHQFLLLTCGAATSDTLFHEAFALSTSGEAGAWRVGDYQSLSEAAKSLSASKSLDTAAARRALARLLAETQGTDDFLPRVVSERLAACDGHGAWPTLTIEALAGVRPASGAALVVMSRHSGEVLWSSGDVQAPRPFGSTLKPFLLAANATTPTLAPRVGDAEWACGDALPATMTVTQAVLRSCNGYFLDWAAKTPGVEKLGAWGDVLLGVGLERLPSDMSETIGLRTTLAISPLGLAAAYRLLAEARPDVMKLLERNAVEGTLAGLPESAKLVGVATKTGTVRDGATRATVGWLVGVTSDLVVVQVVPEKPPRQFVGDFVSALERARAVPGRDAVAVQLFALLTPSQVDLRCARGGFRVTNGQPSPLPVSFTQLSEQLKGDALVCLSAPFEARVQGVDGTRFYAGVLRRDVPAPYVPPTGQTPTERERRARQGSEVILRTTRLSYVAGVLAAEDASIDGEARAALARVISHNVDTRERHGSRPVCDTTHCQAFKGSAAPKAADVDSLGREPLKTNEWLPFARGGSEPWKQSRPRKDVERALGFSLSTVSKLTSEGGALRLTRTKVEDGVPFEQTETLGCEGLRGPLKLPSCPNTATWNAQSVSFEGTGRGHGLGLDVERARKSGAKQDALLQEAFGDVVRIETRPAVPIRSP